MIFFLNADTVHIESIEWMLLWKFDFRRKFKKQFGFQNQACQGFQNGSLRSPELSEHRFIPEQINKFQEEEEMKKKVAYKREKNKEKKKKIKQKQSK